MDVSSLDLPFFDDAHRSLAERLRRWIESGMPAVDHRDTDAACRQLVAAMGAAGLLELA